MPICKECGNKFDNKNIKICEICGSDNISIEVGEFDIDKYKQEMKKHGVKKKPMLQCIFLVSMIIIMLLFIFLPW